MENWNWTKLLLIFSFLIFLGSLLLRQETAITQDLGRHLRLGEMITADGEAGKCALYSNCLTYTYPDYPFINHHWGSEVIFYLVHKWSGFSGIIVFKTIILGLTFIVTLLHSLELNKGPAFLKRPGLLWLAIAVSLVFFSVQMMADRLTTRPEIFGYFLFSILFWMLNSSFPKRLLSLFLVFCSLLIILWVNLHISFVFGLILIWIWAGSQLLASLRGSDSDRGNLGDRHAPPRRTRLGLAMTATAAASTMATIFNPSGLRGTLMPLSILKDYGYTIVENMNPFFLTAFKPQPEYWIYIILLITTIFLFLFSSAKKNPFHLLTFLTFSLFPLIAVRHLPFFALVISPILAPLLFSVLKGPALLSKAGPYDAHIPILTIGFLLLTAFTNPIPLAYAKLPPINLSTDSRHDQAIEFVKQNNFQGPMWNNYDIGSFLEWAIPEHKTFVDGRPEAFPVGFFKKTYIPMQESQKKWDEVTAANDIQWVFAALTDATPWFTKWWQMIQNHQGWKIVYIDNYSTILIRTNGKNNLIEPQGKARLLKTLNSD
ncbi:hypothetical protein HZB78_03310 [Candidatus Collierbacteria bacterium]|nr:hypothetical protein [Candidatus Collierbacteria bacterium]